MVKRAFRQIAGQNYSIRSRSSVGSFDAASLFANGEQGVLYMPWITGTLWNDTAATIPALDGQDIARMNDLSGNNNNAIQNTSPARPTRIDSNGIVDIVLDGIDDRLTATIPTPLKPGWTTIMVFDRGPISTSFATSMSLTANSGANDYIRTHAQTQQNIGAQTYANSVGINPVNYGTSSANTAPGGTRKIIANIVRNNTGQNFQRLNGINIGLGNSNWTVGLALGTSISLLFPLSTASFENGRFSAYLTINRELTLDEIVNVEQLFAANTGITL